MAKILLILTTLFLNHEVLSQSIRQPELLYRTLLESIIESPRQYIQQVETPRQYLQQLGTPQCINQLLVDSYTNGVPIPSVPVSPNFPINIPNYPIDIPDFPININSPNFPINIPISPINNPNSPINIRNSPINNPNSPINNPNFAITNPNVQTLNTGCSPSICKNLASTIQLMVLSDLLKNQETGGEVALRMAGPILSDLLSKTPNSALRPPYSAVPNVGSRLVPSPFSSVLAPSVVPTFSPRVASGSPNVGPNILSSISSNGRIEKGFLSSLLKSLGGGV